MSNETPALSSFGRRAGLGNVYNFAFGVLFLLGTNSLARLRILKAGGGLSFAFCLFGTVGDRLFGKLAWVAQPTYSWNSQQKAQPIMGRVGHSSAWLPTLENKGCYFAVCQRTEDEGAQMK